MNQVFHHQKIEEDQIFSVKNLSLKVKTTQMPLVHDHNEPTQACTLCGFNLVAGEVSAQMPCGDVFHSCCLEPWLEKNNSCHKCSKIINVYYCHESDENLPLSVET